MLSDHFLIDILVSLEKPSLSAKAFSYRKFRQMDKSAFKADLRDSSLVLDPPADLDQLVNLYDYTLRAFVEKPAPLQRKTLLSRALIPWFRKEIQAAKRCRRYCERLWVRTD
jgi:hypothetical protein